MAHTTSASAGPPQTTTYSATQTIPIPPASNYAGAGGGDGWAVALSTTQVFNVFHHDGSTQVSCHNQSDAAACYPVRTITDAGGNQFATSGHPGMFLDQNTGKLYVYVSRGSDSTAGVVCIDTTTAASTLNPFCGYTALTAANDGPLTGGAISGMSNPMQVGTKWYAFNFVNGTVAAGGAGGQNTLLCFDLTTFAACAGSPITMNIGAGTMNVGAFPTPPAAAIGTRIVVPVVTGSNALLACYDVSTGANCAGSWPAAAPSNYPGGFGPPFAMLDSTGALIGLCLPTGTDQCYTLTGASAATPAGMPAAIPNNGVSWNGPGLQLGPRVYVPEWVNSVYCFDYSTGASCTNFPKNFSNLGLLYTVNPDPQRPTCFWVNADNGAAQIQNFDAYTGGTCGQGSIRVLASQFVVNQPQCMPNSYTSLQVQQPARNTYSSGSVEFDDGDGNPIPGAANRPLDGTGTVDLTGLNLNTATGLPQFLITLVGETGNPGSVVVKLVWTGTYDPTCIGPNTTTQQVPTTVTTSLSGGGQSGTHITVPAGTQVTDTATLAGGHAGTAGGTVTYTVYSDNACSTVVSAGSAENITTPGTLPASAPVTLNTAGTYYWLASYSGDGANFSSASNCGDETETVTAASGPKIDGKAATAQHTNTATASVTTNGAGDLLLAFARGDGPGNDGNTMKVSGGGLTWTLVTRENRALGDSEIWMAHAAGKLTAAPITASLVKYQSAYYNAVITVIPFTNATGLGAHATFFSTNGAPHGTLTTTHANSWVFADGNDWKNSINRTPGPGQTIQQQSTDSVGDTYWVQSTTATTPGAGTPVTINDTAPTGDPYNLDLVEIR